MNPELRLAAEAKLPTRFGDFRIFAFEAFSERGEKTDEAVALVLGQLRPEAAPLLRIHSQCLTGDVFHSLRCDCRAQLELAMTQIAAEGQGLIVYEMTEGRGIGLVNKIRAYALQDSGADTVEANLSLGFEADLRDYRLAAAVVRHFGLRRVRLLSNNPEKVAALEAASVEVERVPAEALVGDSAVEYLKVKKEKLGHLIDGV